MLAMTIATLLSAQAADVAAPREPPIQQVPLSGDVDRHLNTALVLARIDGLDASLVTQSATEEIESALAVDDSVVGITIIRLPEQAPQSVVHVRLRQDAFGLLQDVTWQTGALRIEEEPRAPEVLVAELERPFLEQPRAHIEVAPDPARAALLLFAVEDEQPIFVNAAFASSFDSPNAFVDFGYAQTAKEYRLISVDRAGAVSEEVVVVVSDEGGVGGCSSTKHASLASALLVTLFARRRRR